MRPYSTTRETFVDTFLASVAGGRIDHDGIALRWFGDMFPGVRFRRGVRVREEVSFGVLAHRVRCTAAGLQENGMRTGDRVLFSIRPRPEGVILCLAIIHAGGSVVFVDPGSTPELFEARLAAANPRWAATEALLYTASSGRLSRIARARGLLLPDYGGLPVRHFYSGPWLPGVPRGARRAARLGRAAPGTNAGPDDREALVVFTSGTTSDPKAVVHTTASLGGMLDLFAQVGDLKPGRRTHTDQMFLGLPALLAGGTWEIPARTPAADPAAFARGIAGAEASFAVPADVTRLLDHVESLGGSAAGPVAGPRVLAVGAAPVTPALMARATRLLPDTRWIGVYGATEMLPAAVVSGADKVAADRAGDLVGTPLDGVTARIDSPDDDGVGELVLSGPSLMAGYLADRDEGRPPATEHRTGDLARYDAVGRLVLVGRTRDMIIRGTVNIYPGLFEPRLRALPGVADALLVGVPQDDGDEKVVLVLVPGPGRRSSSDVVEIAVDTPLTRAAESRLAGILDHGALPDLVVEASHVPLSGRSAKPDRAALTRAVAPRVRQITAT